MKKLLIPLTDGEAQIARAAKAFKRLGRRK
jgi:hypothetical protein